MKITNRLLITLTFILGTLLHFGQSPIRDRWDTLHVNVDTNFPIDTNYFQQYGTLGIGNDIMMYGDSIIIDPTSSKSYIHRFNPTTSIYKKINYQKFSTDRGITSAAAIQSGTNTPAVVYFGAKAPYYEMLDSVMVLYKLNTSNDAITTETIQTGPGEYRTGIYNMTFFSPLSNHDTLIIFNHRGQSGDSVDVFKKHVNQTGFVNSNITLPVGLTDIRSVFNFNNVLYISGSASTSYKHLLNSADGISYSVNTNYAASSFSDMVIVDMDTLGGYLYLGLDAGDGYYAIAKTNNGISFSTVVAPSLATFSGLQNFEKKLFYVVENSGQIPYRPDVRYIDLALNDILSIDTIGRKHNDVYTFRLTKANNKLLLSGNYIDWSNYDFGTFIYKFVPPVANFSISSTNFCYNTPYSIVSNSTADSVRWFVNSNYYASTSNTFATNFTTLGSNTIGLIAIIGTQKDTLKYTINVYSVGININSSVSGCLNNKIPLTPVLIGAVNPVNYNWTCSSALTQTSLASSILNVTATASGSYTFALNVTDANGCAANTGINTLTVNPNKDLTGAVDVNSVPLTSGNVILYKYEPILTKFDSITYQPLNASGTFTFALQNAFTYIIKCEPTTNTLLITYAPSETSWKTATVVNHGCINGTNQNINVVPLLNIGTGPGMLTGKVVEGQKYGGKGTAVAPGNPISGLTIKGGKNPGGGIVAQGRTNSAGEYTISNLPTNVAGESYFILVDVPGLDTNNTYHKAITSASLQINGLDFVVDSAKINPTFVYASVTEININNDVIRLFPNPTKGLLNIQFALDKPQTIEIVLSDITGKEVRSIMPSQQLFNKEVKLQTQLNELNPGVYLIKLKIGDAERTTRVIITN